MSRWLPLPLLAFLLYAGTAYGAPRDRDRDGLPDRWEKRYHLSTAKKSAKADADRDRLRNRVEYRERTNPRKKDTDGDGIGDGAEVRAGTDPLRAEPGAAPPANPLEAPLPAPLPVPTSTSTPTPTPSPSPSPTPTATPSQPPVAGFSVSPSPVKWDSPVTFSSSGACADAPCTYRWFHGGAGSTEEIEAGAAQPNTQAAFTYHYDGFWEGPATVTLRVTDKDGQSATATKTFSLEQPAATPTPTPSPSPTPTPAPSGGFPDASNTGVPAGSSLTTVDGSVTLSTSGQVYADKQVNGCITVNASNVTIRRVKVVCNGASAIASNSTGLIVEDTEIDCNDAVGHTGLTPADYTARRVNAHRCDNTFWAERNVRIEDSYIHDGIDYDPVKDPHTDGVQMPGGASNITLEHNTIYGNYVSQSSFGNSAITGNSTGYSNITINDNLLAGGGYTLYCPSNKGTDYTLTNNRFSRIFTSTVGGFGPAEGCGDEGGSGNVYHETGQPVPGLGTTASPTPTPTPSPSPTPAPTPTSTACALPAYPDAGCTGVPSATSLTASGSITVSTAGAVIDAKEVTGAIVVNAPNVTIRRTRIRSNAFRAIENNSTGLIVEDSEIINRPISGQPNCHNGIGWGNYTLRRVDISGCENAADVGEGGVVIEDNYFHDLDITGPSYVWGNTPHTDGIQGAGSNVTVRHNTIDPTPATSGADAGIIMGTTNPASANYRVEDNSIDGRGSAYAIYAPRTQTPGVIINRNKVHKGAFGYTACVKLGTTVEEFTDNRDAATNALITPDNGAGGGCTN